MIDGKVMRIVALAALGLAVAGVVGAAVRDREPFYPGRTSGAQVKAQYEVRADGGLDVTETIEYEYNQSGQPLDRVVQLRRPDDGRLDLSVANRGTDRVWKVTHLSATDRAGAPVAMRTKELDPILPPMTATGIDGWDSRLSDLVIQLGDDDKPAGHRATYILRYRVHGALDKTAAGFELNWPDERRLVENPSATEPRAPLDEVRIAAPAGITKASCTAYRSAWGSDAPTPCTSAGPAVFTPGREPAAMTVKVAVNPDGITDGGALTDGSPLSRGQRILLIVGAAILFLVLVGFVAHCLIRGFPLHLRRRA
ncbi:DUF2207 domain-containing protein [Kribbella sp. NPDC003557]|uniref:DUF2207 domain-containing protein n=1 Tax=Kribbella sp. NPDC003557 TaxID=3154449 RepID=UPI0033BAB0F4